MDSKVFSVSWLFLLTLLLQRVILGIGENEQATSPPRGWNSYDSFCWTVSEEEFLQNAELVSQRLHSHGYEYVVVDYLWYRRKVEGAFVDSLGFDVIDEWGRMVPDPDRWPSSKGGKGFTKVAEKVHNMGLKFGIHVMRGLSTQAFNANTPILDLTTGKAYEELGRQWHAKDIGIKERTCAWMKNGFMSVDTKSGAGRAFLKSLYLQYADWGVDFVKNDCVFGDDLDVGEITYVSEVLKALDRPILYSLSPGSNMQPSVAKSVSGLVNMYRITGDDWDTWSDVASHFDVARNFSASNMIGAKGLKGKSWPDLDMLPLGWLTDQGSNEGPHRKCKLTLEEQRTQMTLWSFAKSPLMFGGDMRQLDNETFCLITNPTLLEINSFSSNNMEFPCISSPKNHLASNPNRLGVLEAGPSLSLTTCRDIKAKGWFSRVVEVNKNQICWNENLSISSDKPFCLYEIKPLLSQDEASTYTKHYDGKSHLAMRQEANICLGASPNKKVTSKEAKRGSFSPCSLHANQMWELNNNGTLTSSYSGLCAYMPSAKANTGPNGARAWIATGRKGEIYVAFFNLDMEKAVISVRITDLGKALPNRKLKSGSCKYREEWSGKDLGMIKKSWSAEVQTHGCAVFVLNCS